jgi:hypothetical protein
VRESVFDPVGERDDGGGGEQCEPEVEEPVGDDGGGGVGEAHVEPGEYVCEEELDEAGAAERE